MKQFNGYADAKKAAEYTPGEKLPKGAYVAKILGVKYTEGENGKSDSLTVQFDISEGDYKDFFKKQYESDSRDDKRYKGQTVIWMPTDDGSERDSWAKNRFAKWPVSIEQSNDGYTWDWDEKKWKGKTIGLVFRETGANFGGRDVVFTEVAFPISADQVRNGKAPEAKFYARKGYNGGNQAPATDSNGFVQVPEADEFELPFN